MRLTTFLAAPALILATGAFLPADDVVTLRGGLAVRGLVLDHRTNEQVIRLQTSRGVTPVRSKAIISIQRDQDHQARYELAKKLLGDSTEGHFELALWCQANGQAEQYQEHLQQVLAKNPKYAQARKRSQALQGAAAEAKREQVAKPKENGHEGEEGDRAQEQPEAAKRRGSAAQRGGVRVRREAAPKKRHQDKKRQQEWQQTMVRLMDEIDSDDPQRVAGAERALAAINDPTAIEVLVQMLGRQDVNVGGGRVLRRMQIVRTIYKVPNEDSSAALATIAMLDPAPEMRLFALESLRWRQAHARRYREVFEEGLRSEVADWIANSARAVAELEDPSSVPALIDALETPVRVGATWAVTDYSKFVLRDFLGGLHIWGAGRIRFVPVKGQMRHDAVLEALKQLTEQDFGYNKQAWCRWWDESELRRTLHEAAPQLEAKKRPAPGD